MKSHTHKIDPGREMRVDNKATGRWKCAVGAEPSPKKGETKLGGGARGPEAH